VRAWLEQSLAQIPGVGTQATRRVGPIGLDVGTNALHLCQLGAAQADSYPVLARTSVPFTGSREELLDSPVLLKKLLKQGMRGQGFRGKHMVTALPPDRVRFTPITIKADEKNQAEAVLRMVSDRVEGDIGDYVVDYLPVRTSTGADDRLALAAVARREHVLSYLDALANAGFVVEALDIGPAAIRRALSVMYHKGGEGETILVVNSGKQHTYLSVIAGRRLLFDQAVGFGEDALLEKLQASLELSQEGVRRLIREHGFPANGEVSHMMGGADGLNVPATLLDILKPNFMSLVEEINRVLVFTASETRGRPIERIVMLGSLARWPGLSDVLCKLVGVPPRNGLHDLEDCFDDRSRAAGDGEGLFPEMSVALGLGLRGVVDDG